MGGYATYVAGSRALQIIKMRADVRLKPAESAPNWSNPSRAWRGRNRSKPMPNVLKSGIKSASANLVRNRPNLGQLRPKRARSRPSSAECGPTSHTFGQHLTGSGQAWPDVGQHWPGIDQVWPEFRQLWPTPAKLGRPNQAQNGQSSTLVGGEVAKCCPTSTKSCPVFAHVPAP